MSEVIACWTNMNPIRSSYFKSKLSWKREIIFWQDSFRACRLQIWSTTQIMLLWITPTFKCFHICPQSGLWIHLKGKPNQLSFQEILFSPNRRYEKITQGDHSVFSLINPHESFLFTRLSSIVNSHRSFLFDWEIFLLRFWFLAGFFLLRFLETAQITQYHKIYHYKSCTQ